MAVAGIRKMLFANLYDEREVQLVAHLCTLEACSISNLMRRAIAGLCDEQGIERPEGVFDDRARGSRRAKQEIAEGLRRPVGRPRNAERRMPALLTQAKESK